MSKRLSLLFLGCILIHLAAAWVIPPKSLSVSDPYGSPKMPKMPKMPMMKPNTGKGTCTYTVKSGDTLSGIASQFGTSVSTLSSLNGISNPNMINVGQQIKYPCSGGSGGNSMPSGGGSMPSGGGSMPSGGGSMPSGSTSSQRQSLVACGQALYNNRANEHYNENSPQRWSGIDDKVYPPSAPTYSDCSSAVTWCYWTIFGNGPDIINGENWSAGYTGTMATHGQEIDCSQMQPGDVVLYGSGYPWDHAEMYMGNGENVSHGADPVSYESSTSNQGFDTFQCRSYIQ